MLQLLRWLLPVARCALHADHAGWPAHHHPDPSANLISSMMGSIPTPQQQPEQLQQILEVAVTSHD